MLNLLLELAFLLFFLVYLLLQGALTLLALVQAALMLLLLACEGLPLLALLRKECALLVALALQVEVDIGEQLLFPLDGCCLVLTIARVLLEVLHLEIRKVVGGVIEQERGRVHIATKAIQRADNEGVLGLHAVDLAADHPQGVLRAGDLAVEM